MPIKKKETLLPVGKAIKKFRTQKKCTLAQIANDTGCAVADIKAIEAGKIMPPVGLLLQFSKALGIDADLLLKDDQGNLNARVKAYKKRTENYAYLNLAPGAETKNLKAFKVSIESHQTHEGVDYKHEGEEFIYVLAGKIELQVGDHKNQLKPGDALSFNSGIKHHIRNIGKEPVEMLVVVYVP